MKYFISCLALLPVLILLQCPAIAGTVDSPTISPASSTITVGTSQEITFSAINDKSFSLKEYSVKIKYADGLVLTDLVTSPLAVKAEIYPGRNLIAIDWENIPAGTELKAVFKAGGNIGTYGITPWRIIQVDYNHNRSHGTCNSATVNVIPHPLYPAISNVTVSNITPNSATILWTTDQPTNGRVEYGATTSYGSSAADTSQSTSHSITLTNLSSAATYHFRVTATNSAGLSVSSGDGSFATSNPITLNITSPFSGETIYRPDVSVSGNISNLTANETGVTVNNVVATLSGNQFTANHVPMQEGQNTITVTAVDSAGNTASATTTINAVTTGNYVKLAADTESGVSPMETTLRISGSFAVTNSAVSYSGAGPVEFISTGADEYRVKITAESPYTFTVNVTGPDGNMYQDTLAIVVISKTELDNLLKAKWDGVKSAFANANIEGAVGYFSENSRDSFRQQFTALSSVLPQIAAELGTAAIVKVKGNMAEYDLRTVRNGTTYSFQLMFVRDQDGIWRIKNF